MMKTAFFFLSKRELTDGLLDHIFIHLVDSEDSGSLWNRVGNQFVSTAHPSGEWTRDMSSIFLIFIAVLAIGQAAKLFGTLVEDDHL